MAEINFDGSSVMRKGYPEIKKLGACSPYGEMTPFVWKGKLMRMELCDPSHGTVAAGKVQTYAIIRDVETGKVLSKFAYESYFHSAYIEGDTAYVLGVDIKDRGTINIYESKDLLNWEYRKLLSNPGWVYYNTGLTKGPDGYVLLMEASDPKEHVGPYVFTHFFATSPDLKEWTFMDYDLGFSKERYMGGPWLKYSEGWYYMIACEKLPCFRFTNYIYRTKDFVDWYVGYYNPVIMPDNEDRKFSPRAVDFTDEFKEKIANYGFNSNSSDIDMCDYNGKTYINYLAGNQTNFYYMLEAEYDGTVAQFLKHCFDED